MEPPTFANIFWSMEHFTLNKNAAKCEQKKYVFPSSIELIGFIFLCLAKVFSVYSGCLDLFKGWHFHNVWMAGDCVYCYDCVYFANCLLIIIDGEKSEQAK